MQFTIYFAEFLSSIKILKMIEQILSNCETLKQYDNYIVFQIIIYLSNLTFEIRKIIRWISIHMCYTDKQEHESWTS